MAGIRRQRKREMAHCSRKAKSQLLVLFTKDFHTVLRALLSVNMPHSNTGILRFNILFEFYVALRPQRQ